MKKLMAALIAAAYLSGMGAFAADEPKCPEGQKWDEQTQKCVADDDASE